MKDTINYLKDLLENSQNCTLSIPERLILLRNQHGLSQKELAQKVGLSRSHYCSIEKGNRPLSKGYAEALANFYNISADTLLPTYQNGFHDAIDEHKEAIAEYYSELQTRVIANELAGLNYEIWQLLKSQKFDFSLYSNGGIKMSYITPETSENLTSDLLPPFSHSAKEDNIVCCIRRTNSEPAYFTKSDLAKMQKDIIDFSVFICKRYMKSHTYQELTKGDS